MIYAVAAKLPVYYYCCLELTPRLVCRIRFSGHALAWRTVAIPWVCGLVGEPFILVGAGFRK